MAAVENEDKLRDYLKQVTTTLRRTRKRLRDRDREPIAIVGMGCRFREVSANPRTSGT
jgi:hypothetical protein